MDKEIRKAYGYFKVDGCREFRVDTCFSYGQMVIFCNHIAKGVAN